MPLLRRSHHHCRELRARRPTSRSAVASGRGQDRNAMTSVTASPRRRLPRSLAFGVALLSPRCPPRHPLHRRSGQNRPTDGGGSDKLAAAIVAPADYARQRISNPSRRPSNPHRRQPSTRRPAGSFLGGFRTPNLAAHANRHDRPASETLHQTGPSRRSSASGKPLTAPRVGSRALPFGRQTSASRLRGVAL